MDHPSDETLARFATAKAAREEARAVVAHLIKGCASCGGRLKVLMESEAGGIRTCDQAMNRLVQGSVAALDGLTRR